MTADGPRRFGDELRRLREGAGLTQDELAVRAGMTAQGVGALERGARRRPHPHTVRALAAALGLSEDERVALARSIPRRGAGANASVESLLGGLPAPPTALVGRAREVGELAALLAGPEPRLITLTGPGGVGKSRLAVAVAAAAESHFPAGVALAELAPLADSALVVAAVAAALGLRESAGWERHEALLRFLRPRRVLLVLDNFEHLLPAATDVAALLAACPGVKVLATSRAPLRVRGEQDYQVSPLGLPDLSRVPTPAEVARSSAVELFVRRARDADSSFELTQTNAAAVAAICRRLDGLPLALELAAAWTKLLAPTALLARLDEVLPLLGGARDLPARQRTMRDVVAWSHDLLSPAEQALFRRLAVFAGGFTLEAAEAVGGQGAEGASEARGGHGEETVLVPSPPRPLAPSVAPSVLDGIAALVDTSLVRREGTPVMEGTTTSRFGMLETVRQVARDLLETSGEANAVRAAHAAYYASGAERFDALIVGSEQARSLAWFEQEHDNLRAALAWAEAEDRIELLLRLAATLGRFWRLHAHLSEGDRWLRLALERDPGEPTMWRAEALLCAGTLAAARRDFDQAIALHREGLAIFRALGNRWSTARELMHLGDALIGRGEDAAATVALEESLAIFHEVGERLRQVGVLKSLGHLARRRGDLQRAASLIGEALAVSGDVGFDWGKAEALLHLSEVARAEGHHSRAERLLGESLAIYRDLGDRAGLSAAVAVLASLARETGQPELATRMFGAVASLEEIVGADGAGRVDIQRAAALADLRTRLGDDRFGAEWEVGRALSIDQIGGQAQRLTGGGTDQPASHPANPAFPLGLSQREVEVLRLIATGLTNTQAAERLFLSPRTVDAHLHRIYAKLDVHNRAAAIRLALDNGLA